MNLKKFAAENGLVTYVDSPDDFNAHVGWYEENNPSTSVFGFHSHHAARKDWLEDTYGEIQAKALMESWKKPKIKTKSKAHLKLEKENKKLLAKVSRMAEWIKDAGLRYDVCTKSILGEVCSNCSCCNLPF